MTAQPERRRAPRVSERLRLSISDTGAAAVAETRNLSASGAYCLTDRFIPPMTKLELEFELPVKGRTTTVRGQGVVVRVEPVVASAEQGWYHIAILFSDLSARDREAISAFVRERLTVRGTDS